MLSGCFSFGKRFARALIAFLVVLIAFGRPLDTAAHAAKLEIEAGKSTPLLQFIAAFDVIDDPADHENSADPYEKTQIVVQMAMPQTDAISFSIPVELTVRHSQRIFDAVTSRSSGPPERPPRA